MGEATQEAVARRFVDAFNRRDADALTELVDPAVEWYPSSIVRTRRVYRGHDGLREWINELETAPVAHRARVREVRTLDERRLAVISEVFVGEQLLSPSALLAVFSDEGKIVEAHGYLSDEALLTQLGLLYAPIASP